MSTIMQSTMLQSTTNMLLRTPTQIIETTYNMYCNPQTRTKQRLAADFVPGPHDVVCARGKVAYDHAGNVQLRTLVEQHQDAYNNCTTKHEKSRIVSFICNTIRQQAAYHNGGFVKNIDGLWYEVGDRAAKEKIGQTFRDLLHTKYSSATKAKARARIQKRMEEEELSQNPSEAGTTATQSSKHSNNSNLPMTISITIPSMRNVKHHTANLLSSSPSNLENYSHHQNTTMTPVVRHSKRLSLLASTTTAEAPPQLREENLLDTLRESVQTVDMPPDTLLPAESLGWMRMSGMMSLRGSSNNNAMDAMRMSTNEAPMVMAGGDIVNTYSGSNHSRRNAEPYGIFSSSTKSHPFGSSTTSNPFLRNSIKLEDLALDSVLAAAAGPQSSGSWLKAGGSSSSNPLLMSSVRSSFMAMDLDALELSYSASLMMNTAA